jgi:DNA-binding response OmpR family regulator
LDKKLILVVDDEMLTCKLVRSVLVRRGYDVEIAENANIGFDRALELKPDLVISDIIMPEQDGFDFVRRLRSEPTLTLMPIIMFSAKSEAEDRVRGFRLGADDFLPKPFYPEELFLRVQKVLEKAEELKKSVRKELQRASQDKVVPDFKGDLRYLGFSTLLTMLELEGKTGALSINDEDRSGLLLVRNGRLVSAMADTETSLSNTDAVFEFLSWSQGAFIFKTIPVDCEDDINMTTQSLLFEGARRMDESSR